MTRALITDPDLPRKAADGALDEVLRCIGCNACIAHYHAGTPIACTQNPRTGPRAHAAPARDGRRNGGGSSSSAPAPAASQPRPRRAPPGTRSCVLERSDRIGGQLALAGAAPMHEEVALSLARNYERLLAAGAVELRLGTEADADSVAGLDPDLVVVATGARPYVPDIPLEGVATVQAWDVLAGPAPHRPAGGGRRLGRRRVGPGERRAARPRRERRRARGRLGHARRDAPPVPAQPLRAAPLPRAGRDPAPPRPRRGRARRRPLPQPLRARPRDDAPGGPARPRPRPRARAAPGGGAGRPRTCRSRRSATASARAARRKPCSKVPSLSRISRSLRSADDPDGSRAARGRPRAERARFRLPGARGLPARAARGRGRPHRARVGLGAAPQVVGRGLRDAEHARGGGRPRAPDARPGGARGGVREGHERPRLRRRRPRPGRALGHRHARAARALRPASPAGEVPRGLGRDRARRRLRRQRPRGDGGAGRRRVGPERREVVRDERGRRRLLPRARGLGRRADALLRRAGQAGARDRAHARASCTTPTSTTIPRSSCATAASPTRTASPREAARARASGSSSSGSSSRRAAAARPSARSSSRASSPSNARPSAPRSPSTRASPSSSPTP